LTNFVNDSNSCLSTTIDQNLQDIYNMIFRQELPAKIKNDKKIQIKTIVRKYLRTNLFKNIDILALRLAESNKYKISMDQCSLYHKINIRIMSPNRLLNRNETQKQKIVRDVNHPSSTTCKMQ